MKRTDIIQSLIDKTGAENYLEIGVSAGENFRDIRSVSYTHLTLPTTPYV